MNWIMQCFRIGRTKIISRTPAARTRTQMLRRDLTKGNRLLVGYLKDFGARSIITTQQKRYVDSLSRELSAVLASK